MPGNRQYSYSHAGINSVWNNLKGLGGAIDQGLRHTVLPSKIELLFMDFKVQDAIRHSFAVEEAPLIFSFHLSGFGRARIKRSLLSQQIVHGEPNKVVVSFTPQSLCETNLLAHQRYSIFNIYIAPQQLHAQLDGDLGSLPLYLRHIVDGSKQEPCARIAPLSLRTRIILDQIHNCALHGGMKRLYMECKTIELLLNQLHESSRKSIPHGQLRLRPYDVDRIHEARRIILEKIDSPPSLMELARQVGINTTKLKQGFQQVFKSTVYGAIRQERLRLAHGLLMEGRLSITEIGQQLGFSDASHFIREFSKHYGTTPGRLAKSRHK